MRKIYMSAKCSDNFFALLEEDGMKDREFEGNIPSWFPDEHYGDYVMFDIDLDTGQILNWTPPTKEQVEKTFGKAEALPVIDSANLDEKLHKIFNKEKADG